jgi:hypothetical protein
VKLNDHSGRARLRGRSQQRGTGGPVKAPGSRVAPVVFALPMLLALISAPASHAATAGWSLSPSTYDFGERLPGTGPSAPAIFTLTNTGEVHFPVPLVDTTMSTEDGPEPGVFESASDHCEAGSGLAPAASCTIEVAFDPLYPGPRNGSLTVSDPRSGVAPVSATYSGIGIGPIVSLSPPRISLGSRLLGSSLQPPANLTVSNIGNAALVISEISLPNLGANPNQVTVGGGTCHPGSSVSPGSSCTIQMIFTPSQTGPFVTELKVADNGAHGFQSIELEGAGVGESSEKPSLKTTYISTRPSARTTGRTATFRFAVEGGGVPFVCKLDSGPFRPCHSSRTYRKLSLGTHVFRVKPGIHGPGIWAGAAIARFRIIATAKSH